MTSLATDTSAHGIYGPIPAFSADVPADAVQCSPLIPGASALETVAVGSLASMSVLAPPGTLERRYVLALSLRALAAGGSLTALAPRNRGGARLRAELEAFGLAVTETSKSHFRFCHAERPPGLMDLDAAIEAGRPRFAQPIGLWTQPGIFSWDRIDPGSRLLAEHLPALSGHGADLGCGTGYLSLGMLKSSSVTALDLVDIDRRAIEAARRNVTDPRAQFHWADASAPLPFAPLDFAVTNPPFHQDGAEARALGVAVARQAAAALRKGGELWLVANRHLDYAAPLRQAFTQVTVAAEDREFRVFRAVK